MFTLAIIIGIYSYSIFFLGIFGLLFNQVIFLITLFYCALIVGIFHKNISYFLQNISLLFQKEILLKHKLILALLLLLLLQACINFIGALGPELAFDALWYHLTLPKIYLLDHKIFYIPGGLFYYSAMPKLAEMIYIGALSLGNEITAKFV